MLLDSTATCYGSYARDLFEAEKVRKKNYCVTAHIIAIYIININRWEGGKYSRTTQLIRKDIYSNMKLHDSAYNGHLQVSVPIKGILYFWVGGVDVEISMHHFPVALLSSAGSYVQFNN